MDAITEFKTEATQLKLNFKVKEMAPEEKKKLDDLIRNIIILDMQPFAIVSEPSFQVFVHSLNSNYSLPCRQMITKMYVVLIFFVVISCILCSSLQLGWTKHTARLPQQ